MTKKAIRRETYGEATEYKESGAKREEGKDYHRTLKKHVDPIDD